VGRKYLKGGLGFGGPCFPRDNLAFQRCAEDAGTCAHLSPRVVEVNGEIVDRLFAMVSGHVGPGSTVALLGLSYKPGTHIVEESQSLTLAERLLDAGYVVRMHDPKALGPPLRPSGGGARTVIVPMTRLQTPVSWLC